MKRLLASATIAAALLARPLSSHGAFEDLGAGARAPGMSDAFVAVADDVYALHYNPAGLSRLQRPEVGASYTRLLLGLSDDSNVSTMFFGYAHPLAKNRGTVATAWQQLGLNSGLYQEQTFSLAYGRGAWLVGPGRLRAGGALRYLRRGFGSFPEASNSINGITATGRPDPVLAGKSSVGAMDADLGVLYELRRYYTLGLALKHLTQPNVALGPASDKVPMALALGLNYGNLLSNLGLQYDGAKAPTGARDHNFTFAAERWLPRVIHGDFGLRGGLSVGSRNRRQVTAGLSYRAGRMTIDYGFALWATAPSAASGSHRVSFALRFGSPREPDESLVMILEAMQRLKQGTLPDLPPAGVGLTQEQKAQVDEYAAVAGSLQKEAKYQAALERLSQALSVSPGDTVLMQSYARLNWVAQQVKGLPSFKSDPVEAAWHQGILAYLSQDEAEAIRKVSEALSLDTENKALDGFLAQLEVATGLKRPDIPKVSPKRMRLEVVLAQANAAIEDGRFEEAASLSRQVLEEDPSSVPALENLGTAHFASGDYEASLQAWEKAYALERPARRSALEGHLKSLRAVVEKRRAEAAAAAAAATARPAGPQVPPLSPKELRRLYNEGIDHYASGRLKEAKDVFERVLKADPGYTPARKALRRVQEEMR